MSPAPFFPNDLDSRDGPWVMRELFNVETEASPWWQLERLDSKRFLWRDGRLAMPLPVSHGFLVALSEVVTEEHASAFASKNRIRLIPQGGIALRSYNSAEVFIHTNLKASKDAVRGENSLYRIGTRSGARASVGFASELFARLVSGPIAESVSLPDEGVLTTLVMEHVPGEEIEGFAEVCLFHLREAFPNLEFRFWSLPDYALRPQLPLSEIEDPPRLVDDLPHPSRTHEVAFYNRALESDWIVGWLYLYRVIEACFDDVLNIEVQKWRQDGALSSKDLMSRVRRLHWDGEDRSGLRLVLGEIIEQPLLDEAHRAGLVADATADSLRDAIYLRRNSIAHGRRGAHPDVLVPRGVTLDNQVFKDRSWFELMRALARKALDRWIFSL